MKKNLLFIIAFFLSQKMYTQNFNIILQVNDVNIDGEITGMYLSNCNERNENRIQVNYYPGDLIIPDYEKLYFEKLNENFILTFKYNTYKKKFKRTLFNNKYLRF